MRRPNRLTGDVPQPPALICDGGGTVPPDILAVELDDATAAYVCAVQPAFDLLRQAAGQSFSSQRGVRSKCRRPSDA
jgi:hypothetical protein